jgi:hypothetical protein
MTLTSEYIQNLLTFPFRDAKWKEKMLVGSLIAFASFMIPFIPQLLLTGYGVQMARRMVLENAEPHLPEWNDWGALLMDGLRVGFVRFVYLLPVFVPFICGYLGLFGSIMTEVILDESGRAGGNVEGMFTAFGFLIFFGSFFMAMILLLPTSLIMAPASTHAAVKQEFAAAFRFRAWWPIFRGNLSGYILGFVLLLGLGIVAGFALQIIYFTIILCFILPLVIAVYAYYASLIYEAVFAQIYREGVQKLAAP